MQRPRFMRYLYNRWLFLVIALAGLGNVLLLGYRFAVLGLPTHTPEHVVAGVFSLLTCALATGLFVDLSVRNPNKRYK